MGKQIEQMEQQTQSPQLLFYNDSTANQTGPPYYVDLFIEAGLTAAIPFEDGKSHLIKGPDTCLLVSNKPEPPRPINFLFDNLKQVVDRNGTLRQLVILNTNNQQPTNTYSKRKSTKQIDNNNNNTNGSKNGLTTNLVTNSIYGKCSPNPTVADPELIAISPDQYPYCCQLCYDYVSSPPPPLNHPLNGNPQINGHNQLTNSINNSLTATNQMNTVPTPTNATNLIYNQPIPLIDPTVTNLHAQISPQTVTGQLNQQQTTLSIPPQSHLTAPQQTNSLQPQSITCSTFNSPQAANSTCRPFNLDNLLNSQTNNLLLKAAAKSKLNLPVNYGQFNGQATTNQFLLNSSNLVNATGKLSPKHNYPTTANNSTNYNTANSPTNGHQLNGHHLISNKQLKEPTAKHKSCSIYEEQPNKRSTNSYMTRNSTTLNTNNLSNKNKAKSIYSHHHYSDAYHHSSHLHANQATINYELKEKVRKDKYNLASFTSDKMNSTSIQRNVKRKDAFKLIDKQLINNRSTTVDEQHEQLTNNSYKRFDEIKSNKSVDSPVTTSSSPISEHYDFSSEESEANLPTNSTNTSTTSKSTNQSSSSAHSIKGKLLSNKRGCDEIMIKNSKNLNSTSTNYIINNYSTHYRQTNKDAYHYIRHPIRQSNSTQKSSRESLEQINKPKEFNGGSSKELKIVNKKKLMQEEDRDDGYVGDELDYRVYNVDDLSKRTNKLNNSVQQKFIIPSSTKKQQPNSSSFNDIKMNQKTKLTNASNKKPTNQLVDQLNRSRDELVPKTNLYRENSLSKDNLTKDHSMDSSKENIQKDDSISNDNLLTISKSSTCSTIKKDDLQNLRNKIDQQTKVTRTKSEEIKKEIQSNVPKTTNQEDKKLKECKLRNEITISTEESTKESNEEKPIDEQIKEECLIEESSSSQPKDQLESLTEKSTEKVNRIVNLKQNEMPIVYAFNLIETLVTSNLVRLKWTKNNGISLTNLDRPNYQIEMTYLKKEETSGQNIKCSRIVQQCNQKYCKISNLNSEQEYTFRVRLVYEEQLYLSNDLLVITLPNDKLTNTSKKNKLKNQQVSIKDQQMDSTKSTANYQQTESNRLNLDNLKQILIIFKSKFSIIGKEKFYALFYLFLFFTLCYLFVIITIHTCIN